MKVISLLLLFCLAACAAPPASTFTVGRREAGRLRASYAHWIAERPRKLDDMEVPTAALSDEARYAGFHDASVDSEIVLLRTTPNEGLIFGRPSPAELEGLRKMSFTVEPTAESDILRFRLPPDGGRDESENVSRSSL